jgi:dTDP-3-amino-2,3,6-trideoxy-4-keto-D-glucose/dTDP-3-amino-3,4,6-trideoxy-alpha-D-glucose/dTDP-2,6-dideoxy-D-kanosamine transaminase
MRNELETIRQMKDIPLFRHSVNDELDTQIRNAVMQVVDSNWYVLGAQVSSFEAEFAAATGVKHCVSVANGTDALEIALRSVGVVPGDRVGLVANAGFYGSTAVHLIGATPVYCDVSDRSLNMAVADAAEVLSTRPKAIVVTHLYGRLAAIEEIVDLAAREGVPVLEDCAQSHGAMRAGHYAGSFGVAGCFSFYPTKNLGAIGDGGAIVTNDGQLADRLRQIRQYGWTSKYRNEVSGGRNSRLDEIQAAVLRVKLQYLGASNEQRRGIARRYNSAFADLPLRCPLDFDEDFVAHLYVLRVAQRDAFRAFLRQHGVATDVHYPIPDHLQTSYRSSQLAGTLPVTEAACETVVSLPCFPGLQDGEVELVIKVVRQYFEQEVA